MVIVNDTFSVQAASSLLIHVSPRGLGTDEATNITVCLGLCRYFFSQFL